MITITPFLPPVIAHRGASAYAPENTLAAFQKAYELGVQWVEFDIMLAACGEIVVIHDDTLERTTDGTGMVSAYSYDYLKTLDAGSWFNPVFKKECIPTLKMVIECLNMTNLSANIEIKGDAAQEERLIDQLIPLIEQNIPLKRVLFSSFSFTALQMLHRKATHFPMGYLLHEWESDWEEKAHALDCLSLNLNHEILTQESVDTIKSSGKLLLSYTVNDPARAKTLLSWGVDAIFSDNPVILDSRNNNF